MITPTLDIEKKFWERGYKLVCGIDEVGRGSFAGAVVAGAVIFPPNCVIPAGIADSKLLKPRTRERLSKDIKRCALFWSIAEINVAIINKVGIGKATQMAFRRSVNSLEKKADFILTDYYSIKHLNKKRQKAIRDGDKICTSIAAASIIAKVHRDALMKKIHKQYPQYGFSRHKGYGTKMHQQAIKKYGLSKIHRRSFSLEKFLS